MSCPSTSIEPLVGVSKPAIMRRIVVLPQPEGPSREMNSPLAKAKLTPCTTVVVPKALGEFVDAEKFCLPWSVHFRAEVRGAKRASRLIMPIAPQVMMKAMMAKAAGS
jgi:hypothetical protein